LPLDWWKVNIEATFLELLVDLIEGATDRQLADALVLFQSEALRDMVKFEWNRRHPDAPVPYD
jgi:hypothetical protein